jgi:hypothetical protein
VNKRDKDVVLALPQAARKVEFVDQTTKSDPPASRELKDSMGLLEWPCLRYSSVAGTFAAQD